MLLQYITIFLILGAGVFASIKYEKLTTTGALLGGILGLAIFMGAGFTGLILLATFFILGSVATAWKINSKINLGLAELNKGRRTAGQVFANGGVAGIFGLLSWWFPGKSDMYILMLAGSFAAATADTLASELGNIYGRQFYNILTFKPDKRGENGVISLEGTVCGLLGSCLIALLYGLGFGWHGNIFIIIIAGTIGNLVDSVLGATLENRGYLSNNFVNFLNTLTGALAAGMIYILF